MIQFIQIDYSDKWTKINVNIGICLGNSHGNFQLHRFTTSENIAKCFRGGLLFDSHCRAGSTYPGPGRVKGPGLDQSSYFWTSYLSYV